MPTETTAAINRARLEAERRARKLRLADLEIEAIEIETRIAAIEQELQNVR